MKPECRSTVADQRSASGDREATDHLAGGSLAAVERGKHGGLRAGGSTFLGPRSASAERESPTAKLIRRKGLVNSDGPS